MKVFVNDYSAKMFHKKEDCAKDIERAYLESEDFSEFVHECRNGLTEQVIEAIVRDSSNKEEIFAEMKADYQLFLNDFIHEHLQEMDEEKAKELCWYDDEIY